MPKKKKSKEKRVEKVPQEKEASFFQRHALIVLLLIVATFVIYGQTLRHGFVNYDDNIYVYENPQVLAGLTVEGLKWAFKTFHAYNYHPLTWVSHMLDCHLFGINPGVHHLVSLLFHLANAMLLYWVLFKMTGAPWRSGFVALLFAVHPMHVESVAWVAERKDVLSTFFWMLGMGAYIRYVEVPGLKRYLLVLLCLGLGLLSKPMVVTLPFVFLLLDYWPLKRLQSHSNSEMEKGRRPRHLILEKVPLFILVAVSSIVTVMAQSAEGAVRSLIVFSIPTRIALAILGYASYIGKMLWPQNLAVFYPLPPTWTPPVLKVLAALVFLACVTIFSIKYIRRGPYLLTGWLWYLGTLIPVIGLVQVGSQAVADRYTYIPYIGLFIMFAWGMPELINKRPWKKKALAVASIVVTIALVIAASFQTRHWKNGETLWVHALKNTKGNPLARNNYGELLRRQGRFKESVQQFAEAVRIHPGYTDAYVNMGRAFAEMGDLDGAVKQYTEAIKRNPDHFNAHNNMANALARKGDYDQAIVHYEKCRELNPDSWLVYGNMGSLRFLQQKYSEAEKMYRIAIQKNRTMLTPM